MKLFDVLRGRSTADAPEGEDPSAAATDQPIPGYDKLDERKIGARLGGLTQVELAAVEEYERSHQQRPKVLDKLRYMRTNEPLPGYDALSPPEIAEALAGADSATVKAVRDYERKFAHRPAVIEEAARVLPSAEPSPDEARAREAQHARVRAGFKSRSETTRELGGG